jgi:hypothetical protein
MYKNERFNLGFRRKICLGLLDCVKFELFGNWIGGGFELSSSLAFGAHSRLHDMCVWLCLSNKF